MARRFFYVSLGVLALALAWNLGARSARADWDSSLPGQIIGGGHQTAYTVNGEAWDIDMGWVRMPEKDLPVPPAQVKLIFTEGGQVWVITTSDDLYRTGLGPDWTFLGAFPGSSTFTEKTSWGGIKKQYR